MDNRFLKIAAILGFLAVVIGAFGSHGLKGQITIEQLETYRIGVRYQFFHTFAILAVGILWKFNQQKSLKFAGWLFFAGVVLFSGSIYLLSCREVLGIENWKWLGPVTPLGGLLFLSGWISLFISFWKGKD